MKIMIIGAMGQLGTALQLALAQHQLTLLDLPELDITDRAVVETAAYPNKFISSILYCLNYLTSTQFVNCYYIIHEESDDLSKI